MEQPFITSTWFCFLLIFAGVTSSFADDLTSSLCNTCTPVCSSPPPTSKSPPFPPVFPSKPPPSPSLYPSKPPPSPKVVPSKAPPYLTPVHNVPPPPRFNYFDSPLGMTPPTAKSYPPPAFISAGGNNGGGPSPPRFVYFPSTPMVGAGAGAGGGVSGQNAYPYPYYMYDSNAVCFPAGILRLMVTFHVILLVLV